MNDEKHLDPVLEKALNLDGSIQSIQSFYAGWAADYNSKTASWDYAAPQNAIHLMHSLPTDDALQIDVHNKQIKIMDAGCGTGLVGQQLTTQGYTHIDGFDLCDEMVSIAKTNNSYQQLQSNIDINQPIQSAWQKAYDCTLCTGVFTHGHVPPQAISQLQAMTRLGGLIILSTRVAYYAEENFQAVSDQMEQTKQLKLLATLHDATYTEDSLAHYWAYAVLQ